MAKKGGLQRGMDYLFQTVPTEQEKPAAEQPPRSLRISEIEPNRGQPRRNFDAEELAVLADSIRSYGVLQPVLVRPMPNGEGYQLVAGERRWRAARLAGLTEIPAVVQELDDLAVAEISLVENLQRSDLNPIEEAMGYQTLMEQYEYTQEEVAQRVGKSRPAVANALRLLQLSPEVKEMVENGTISAGHARALLAFSPPEQKQIANRIVAEDLSVRQVEALAHPKGKAKAPAAKPHFYEELEVALKQTLGRRVTVSQTGKKKGKIVIEFKDEEDLRELSRLLS